MRDEDGVGQGGGHPPAPHLHPPLHAVPPTTLRAALQCSATPTTRQQGITPNK